MAKVTLRNSGPSSGDTDCDLYFPRLQVNKHGEIVLATAKHNTLTTGILVGKTPESKSTLTIGQQLTDWEVCGELTDYDGKINVTFINQVPTEAFDEITCRGHLGQRGLLRQRRDLPEDDPARDPLTKQIVPLVKERDKIVKRFEKRKQLPTDKKRLDEINRVLY